MYVVCITNAPFLIAPITQANIDQKGNVCTKTTFAWNHWFTPKAELVACFVSASKRKLWFVNTAKHGTHFYSAQAIFNYYLIPANSPNTNPEWSS